MKKRMIYMVVALNVVLAGVLAWKATAAGYESAEYKVIESEDKFEVREYPELMLASTQTKPDSQGRDGSFMKLFGYISGANEAKQKISMTTPVFMQQDDAASKSQMGFVMPKEVAVAGAPTPTGQDVNIRKRPGGRYSVVRFSGQLNAKTAAQAESKLRAWMKSKGLVALPATEQSSGVETAGYDPPFTPGPMRRNEVLIRLQ
jgi:DNA gyrase inhibitor GyrI